MPTAAAAPAGDPATVDDASSTGDPAATAVTRAAGTTFADLGVDADICADLADAGIVHPFPIQEMTLPLALGDRDLIGQAKTGTGKTLGFGIPLLSRVVPPTDPAHAELSRPGAPQALVVVPTRELGIQVAGDLEAAGRRRGVRVLCVYGGRAYEPQIEALRTGIEVVVGTPGRLIDLATQRHLDLSQVRVLVLDEADEMLDMGFLPDVERLVAQTPAGRQTMLFSATMPGQIVNLARRYMTQPTHIRATDPTDDSALVEAIEQHVWRAHVLDKPELLARVLQARGRGLSLIFCRTKRTAQKVADDLVERGFAAAAVHGDLGQGAREQALRAFRNGKVDVLVATDVAARGIDVPDITHVVNYECPDDEKTYLHRIGRTGRAGASGVAVTFVDWRDITKWQVIDKALGLPFKDPLETYSSSEHVYTGLGIPADVTGLLPTAKRTRAGLDAEAIEDLGETGKARSRRSGESHREPRRDDRRDRPRRGGDREAPRTAEAKDDDAPKRGRTRQRRRTRGGTAADVDAAAAPASGAADERTTVSAVPDAGAAAVAGEAAAAGGGTPRRRRRSRGRGRGGDSGGTAAGGGGATGSTAESEAPSSAD